ncbi:MAG: hypothetical protein RL131_1534 [Bacteroidota bacterium]
MKHFGLSELQAWDRFYRGNFVNSLSGFKPASLIGTVNREGIQNLAIFSNIVHLGADPALIGFINRPREAAPHTLANIEATGQYSINHIHADFADKAHQTSAKYPQGMSEFSAVGLSPHVFEDFKAPFVSESKIQFGLELDEIIPLKQNSTYLVVGKLIHAFVDESLISDDGFIDASKAMDVVSLGLDAYYTTSPLARYAYAKADQPIRSIPF